MRVCALFASRLASVCRVSRKAVAPLRDEGFVLATPREVRAGYEARSTPRQTMGLTPGQSSNIFHFAPVRSIVTDQSRAESSGSIAQGFGSMLPMRPFSPRAPVGP